MADLRSTGLASMYNSNHDHALKVLELMPARSSHWTLMPT